MGKPCHYACLSCHEIYPIEDRVPVFFRLGTDEFKTIEALVQSEIALRYGDIMQLDALRNSFYHADFQREILQLPSGATILEIGCGTGQDGLSLAKRGYNVIECDISKESVFRARALAEQAGVLPRMGYLVADGENVPLASASIDAALLVASLHHMRDPEHCLRETVRCVKEGGLVVLGIEPNRWYYRFFRPMAKRVEALLSTLGRGREREKKLTSIAEATASGFGRQDLLDLFDRVGVEAIRIKPVWYLCGSAHYSLELLFVALGLPSRISLSPKLEKFIIAADELIGRLPVLDRLPWHWNAVAGKPRAR